VTDYPFNHTPDLMAQTDGSTARLSSPTSELAEVLAALSADAANWRTLLAELTARGFEYMSLEAILCHFATTEELAPLIANLLETSNEATNWHTLLFALNARGFENMTLQNIIDVFPDFRTLAHGKDHADPPRRLQATRDEFLAAARNVNASFMPDPIPPRSQKRPATIQHTQPVDVFPGDLTLAPALRCTAISCAQQLVVLVGDPQAIATAVFNDKGLAAVHGARGEVGTSVMAVLSASKSVGSPSMQRPTPNLRNGNSGP